MKHAQSTTRYNSNDILYVKAQLANELGENV